MGPKSDEDQGIEVEAQDTLNEQPQDPIESKELPTEPPVAVEEHPPADDEQRQEEMQTDVVDIKQDENENQDPAPLVGDPLPPNEEDKTNKSGTPPFEPEGMDPTGTPVKMKAPSPEPPQQNDHPTADESGLHGHDPNPPEDENKENIQQIHHEQQPEEQEQPEQQEQQEQPEQPQEQQHHHHHHPDEDDPSQEMDLVMEREEPVAPLDPEVVKQQELIDRSQPTTELEQALYDTLKRRDAHIDRLTNEVKKLKAFISKRKQTYKRKRKDMGAPTRALSAYNIFVQDRFSQLAKENEQALNSADTDAQLKRVPPASLVATTGNQWKELSAEEKAHYEERAREDRKRYEEQMAKYQPPDKQANRKRNKTGYNMFFSAHVLRLKQSEAGVPSERGSVARLVGNAWKQLSTEEKQYYEREADKQNGMNPVEKDDEEDDDEMASKRGASNNMPPEYHPNGYMHQGDMHMHMPPPPMHNMHQPPPPHQHDPRHQHYAPYPTHHMHYGQPPYHGYHDQSSQGRSYSYHKGSSHGYHQGYPPPPPRHYGENGGMTM